jgi:hypothetical protein
MAEINYEELSDEDLDRMIAGDVVPPPKAPGGFNTAPTQARNEATRRKGISIAEEIEPSWVKRALAGFGGTLQEPFVSGAEKFQLAFPGQGEAGQQRIAEIGNERAQRRGALRQLRETPAGQVGSFGAEVIPYAIAPATIPAQMATAGGLGFLRGGPDRPRGIGQELATSALEGGIDAATTGLSLKGLDYVGRGLNAARGKFTPAGQRLLDTDTAAQRAGLTGELRPTIGQLDASSPIGNMERNMASYPGRVQRQAEKLKESLDATRQVPVPGGGMAEQVVPGGNLSQELKASIGERYKQARDMYQAVDDLALQKGVGNVTPIYSVPQLLSMQKKAVGGDEAAELAVNLVNNYDDKALTWIGDALQKGASQKDIKAAGIPMTTYHDMRVAVNKAIGSLDRVQPANKTAAQSRAQQLLQDLRSGLDNEVERWASTNSGTREVVDQYKRAKQFYSDVVAPAVVQNPFARKVGSRNRPFNSAEELYGAIHNPRNQELIERLEPTMSGDTRAMMATLKDLPEVAQTLATRQAPQMRGTGPLSLAMAAAAHPGAAASLAPGVSQLSRTGMAKRLYAAEPPLRGPLGRALAPAAQYPQEDLENAARRILDLR